MANDREKGIPHEWGMRMVGERVTKPFVLGNKARKLPVPIQPVKTLANGIDKEHTHEWTMYLRPYYKDEDLSLFIKKVAFRLHESFGEKEEATTCHAPPYELTRTGYGEFEMIVRVYFHDPNERALALPHTVRLMEHANGQAVMVPSIVSEFYDEFVFTDPSQGMYKLLTKWQPTILSSINKFDTDFEKQKRETVEKLRLTNHAIRGEIEDKRERHARLKNELEVWREKARALHSPTKA